MLTVEPTVTVQERGFFRSTAAHNTVMANNTEQSQCWGVFRLAKRSKTNVLKVTDDSIAMEMTDHKGQKVIRSIVLSDVMTVVDSSKHTITSFVHLAEPMGISHNGKEQREEQPYAEDYGISIPITVKIFHAKDVLKVKISLEE